MVPPSDRRPQRPGSSPDALDTLFDEQPERAAVHHPAVDGEPQPAPRRTATRPQMAALKAPPIIDQGRAAPLAPTVPAPNPLRTQTWRVPTPPSAVAHARRSDRPVPSEAIAPQSAAEGQLAALLAERDRDKARIAELERDTRAAAEAKQVTYPPPVQESPRKPSPVPDSGAKRDQAIGAAVRTLAVRVAAKLGWTPLLVALGLGGGATAVLRPSVDPAKAEATLANTEAIKRELELTRRQLNGLLDREAARDVYLACLAEQQAEYFAQLTPAADKMGAAAPLKPFVDRCKNRRP